MNSEKRKEIEMFSYGVAVKFQIVYYTWSYKSSYSSSGLKNEGIEA